MSSVASNYLCEKKIPAKIKRKFENCNSKNFQILIFLVQLYFSFRFLISEEASDLNNWYPPFTKFS